MQIADPTLETTPSLECQGKSPQSIESIKEEVSNRGSTYIEKNVGMKDLCFESNHRRNERVVAWNRD
jgi:hypothetical protein